MARSITIIFTIIMMISCLYAVLGSPSTPNSNSNNLGQVSGVLPKKVHVLSPGLSRMYRLLRYGSNGSGSDDEDLFLDDDNTVQKRQYDDYGHMRFGKRQNGDFDDYGHLRFGK